MYLLKEKYFTTPLLLLLALLGCIVSFIFFINLKEQSNVQIEEKFKYTFQRQTNSFQRELDLNIQILYSIERFYSSSENVTRDEFKTYVKYSLDKHKSIQALEWIPLILDKKRKLYEYLAQNELKIDFNIKEKSTNGQMIIAKKRKSYYPVYYMEPLKGNEKALGFDLASNAIRLSSLKEAKETREIAITDKITLVQEKGKQSGFLIFIPIWEKQKQKQVKGFILGVYRIGDMIKTAYNYNKIDSSMVTTWLVDETKVNKHELLFTNGSKLEDYKKYKSLPIKLHNKIWVLYAKESQAFINQNKSNFHYFVLITGLLLTLLITYIFSLKIKKNIKLQKDIDEKTKNLLLSNTKLEELNKTLNIQIEKGTVDNRKKDQLLLHQSKLAAMGEMIGAISHQWRQPLNTLALQVQFIEEDYNENEIDKNYITSFSNKCMNQINYMSKTIDDFKNFFKSQKKIQEFNTYDKIKESTNLIKAQLDNFNIDINIKGEKILINNYPNEFCQVILNIINNSKDAIVENNIMDGNININIIKKDNLAQIIIEDNAGGIPIKIIEKIFEPYFTTKEQGKGTGLGLYMAKVIIEDNMKGKIQVENTKDGSKFIIQIGTIDAR